MDERAKTHPALVGWGVADVAGRRLRLWADLSGGRVVVRIDEEAPRDVGLAVDIDADDRRGRMILAPRQAHWAGPARDEVLHAAIRHYNRVARIARR